ncbi:NADH-quinone oxidoreductase subunit N [Planctomycetota bacterium]
MSDLLESLQFFSPELLLVIFGVFTLISDATLSKRDSAKCVSIALMGVITAILASIILYAFFPAGDKAIMIFSGQLSIDKFGLMFKIIILVGTALVMMYAPSAREFHGRRMGEYYLLLMIAAIGMCMLVTANTMLMLYLSLETMSLCCYLLVGYLKEDRRSSEAALKYLIFGGVSAAIMLYGISLLYGVTGTLVISEIGPVLEMLKYPTPTPDSAKLGVPVLMGVLHNSMAVWVALAMILGGIFYKVAVVPFHFWSPDAYEGAPTPVSAFLSVASKAAGMGILIRIVSEIIVPIYEPFRSIYGTVQIAEINLWPYIFAVIAVLSMFLGNLAALRQKDVKRMLAYSSIAHAGYMMIGITVATYNATNLISPTGVYNSEGFVAVMFYLVVYTFMNIGAFLVAMVVINQKGNCRLEAFNGLVYRSPFLAIAMGFFLFSLAGLPPTGGFIGKFYLFKAAINDGWYWLTFLGLINSVISLYYYARVMNAMTFVQPDTEAELHTEPLDRVVMGLCIFPIIVTGLYFWPVYSFSLNSFNIW